MSFDPNVPYNDLPLLPPSTEIESKEILRKVANAGRALAELKGLGKTIPNQSLLVNSIVLQEAKASSEIENIVTTNDALFKAFTAQTSNVGSSTKEVLRYREALWNGYEQLNKKNILSTNLFVQLVQIIKKNQAGIRKTPGTTIFNVATNEIIYTPPDGESVIREKLKNLEDYIHSKDDIDPLIKLALIHYQFEAIHPFSDGNGRTGRIINILYLVQQGLLELPVLYLSKFIIEKKNDYYHLIRQVTEQNLWEPWIIYILEAVQETSNFTRDKILEIRDLMNETFELAKEKLPRRVYSKELIEIIFRQPYTKGQFLVDEGIAERKTAAEYLKELEKVGILSGEKVGIEMLYINTKLYDLLSK